jgi:hypothetical protein
LGAKGGWGVPLLFGIGTPSNIDAIALCSPALRLAINYLLDQPFGPAAVLLTDFLTITIIFLLCYLS